MIPKRLFYCWFGKGQMSELNCQCLDSWSKYLNDWEVIRIDESNFDIYANEYSAQAYEHKNWSFVSDVARSYFLERYGGLYLDTDVLVLKMLDEILDNRAVVSMLSHGFYNSHMMGCEEGYFPEIFKEASNFESGKAIHVNLNNAIYEHFDLKGEEYIQLHGIGFYGNSYVANKASPVTDRTLMIHQETNSWIDGWKNGFKVQGDFIPFDIVVNGQRQQDLTERWFSGNKPIGELIIPDRDKATLYVIDYGNYFYNPKVVAVFGDGFAFKKYGGRKETARIGLYDGTILEYEL